MTITARFASQCGRCGQAIAVGSQINWVRGQKATHIACPAPKVEQAPVARMAVEDAGVYVMADGSIVKVKANRDKSRTYAMRWTVIGGERLTEADSRVHGEYTYEPGLVQQVAAEGRKMTLDEAKAFILRYGLCCRCGRRLKAADSVERGIGPVCVKYFTFGTVAASAAATAAVAASYSGQVNYDDERPAGYQDADLELREAGL